MQTSTGDGGAQGAPASVRIGYIAAVTDQLRDKFKKLRLAAEIKERDEALAVSAAEKARRAEETARDSALDGAVRSFLDELPEAVALLTEMGVNAHIDGDALVAAGKIVRARRMGLTVVIEENGRPAGMLEYKSEPTKRLVYVDGKPFEGFAERLANYLDRLVTDARKR